MKPVLSILCTLCLLVFTCGAPAFGQFPPQYPAPQYPAPQYPAPQYPAQQYPAPQYPAPQYPAAPAPAPQQPGNQPLLAPQQLDNLVAPIALYPDPLLGQVLAASTYPLEIVEAQQWLQQNSNLHGADLINAARQQNWDPSVQALVAFPDLLAMLNRDVQWTTDLGNAFLAQQKDVMDAVQRMRVRAQQNGRLSSNSQETVTTQTQDGQSAVVIEPANPQTVYVPVYNPDYVWGPPVYGYYPPLWYPPVSFGIGFGPGIFLSAFFPGWLGFGWGGWGLGWGWGFGWFGGGLSVNSLFFNHFGFHGFYGGALAGGRFGWAHDPYHRAGVPYANSSVASRFNNARFSAGRFGQGSFSSAARSYAGGASRGFGGSASPAARSFSGGSYRGYASPGFNGAARSYSAPRSYGGGFNGSARAFSGGGYSGGRSFGGGERSSGGGGHYSGGHSFGGGHSGGGHSGGHGGGHR